MAGCDGLPHFPGVQASMADQFAVQQQYGDLVAMPHPGGRLGIHVDDLHGDARRRGEGGQFSQHFLA